MAEEVATTPESSNAVGGTEAADGVTQEAVDGGTSEGTQTVAPAVEGTLATEGDKPAEGEGTLATEGAKPEGEKSAAQEDAPETYKDFDLPEGITMDAEALAVAMPIFKEKKFTQDQAQAVVSLQAEMVKKAGDQQLAAWQKVTKDWRTETKADKDFGGDNLDANLGLSAHALKTLGTPELIELLDTTGIGNALVMNKFLAAVGNAIGEDTVHPGKASGSETGDPLDNFYDAGK